MYVFENGTFVSIMQHIKRNKMKYENKLAKIIKNIVESNKNETKCYNEINSI